MFPVHPVLAFYFLPICVVVGSVVGALIGFSCFLLFKFEVRAIIKDALLGASGFLMGIIGCALVPWPRNTITYYVDQTQVQSTMDRYQHPEAVAFVLAALLPLLHELWRFKQSRSN